MSLISWIPLIGTKIEDKCQKRNLSTASLTKADTGKLGQGYKFDGDSSYLTIPNVPLSSSMSFSAWVNMAEIKQCFLIDARNSEGVGYQPLYYDPDPDKGIQLAGKFGDTLASQYIQVEQLDANKWYHIAISINNGIGTLYIDGIEKGSTIDVIKEDDIDMLQVDVTIGSRYSLDSGTKLNGSIQDIRIYDHALSKAEVKELSKALAIHYSFNDILAEPTKNLLPLELQNMEVNSAREEYGDPAQFNVSEGIVQGADYTLSLFQTVYPESSSTGDRISITCEYTDGTSDTKTINDLPKDGQEHYYEITIITNKEKTVSKLTGWILDHSSGYGKIRSYRNAQIESHSFATPYTPNKRNSLLANEAGLTQPSNVNNLKITQETNLGIYAGEFDGNTTYIDTPVIKPDMFTDDYTLNFWVYPFEGEGRSVFFGDYQLSNQATNFERTADGKLRYWYNGPYIKFDAIEIPVRQWTMITITYSKSKKEKQLIAYKNNGTIKEEVDHIMAAEMKKESTTIRIGRDSRDGNDEATPFHGYMSDFRYYATCLTSKDVKHLYERKAMISRNSTVLCPQFVENKNKIQVTKRANFEISNEIIEEDEISKVYMYNKDKNVSCFEIIEV